MISVDNHSYRNEDNGRITPATSTAEPVQKKSILGASLRTVLLVTMVAIVAMVGISLIGCGSKPPTKKSPQSPKSTSTANDMEAQEEMPTLVFLGDSLTEGYRVGLEENYPSLVEKKLAQQGVTLKVVNGGLSGDTSAGGLERLDWFLKLNPEYLFLALGSNDGLRGLQLEETYNNLAVIIERCQEKGVKVFLAGLKLPPNYGMDYTEQFEEIFSRLQKTYSLPLYPFLLAGVAGEPDLNLDDGIHPNPQGYEIISDGVAEFITQNL